MDSFITTFSDDDATVRYVCFNMLKLTRYRMLPLSREWIAIEEVLSYNRGIILSDQR